MAATDNLSWLCPGRKVLLSYTPPCESFKSGPSSHSPSSETVPPQCIVYERNASRERQESNGPWESLELIATADSPDSESVPPPADGTNAKRESGKSVGHSGKLGIQSAAGAKIAGGRNVSVREVDYQFPAAEVAQRDSSSMPVKATKRKCQRAVSYYQESGDSRLGKQREEAGVNGARKSALAEMPKYTATVLDAPSQGEDKAFTHVCTVFIVPQGMELDWLISTPEGQDQIVAGADAARVFLVTLNRGYKFTSAEDVQKELSPWIRTLVPTQGLSSGQHPGVIPYTITPQGIGQRTVLEEAWSEINGPIVVEDVELLEPGKLQSTTFRRMVFLDSPSLIQSEAVLVHPEREIVHTRRELGSTELEIEPERHMASDNLGLDAKEGPPQYKDGFNVSEREREVVNKKAPGNKDAEREHRKRPKRTVGTDTNSPNHRKEFRADSSEIEACHRKRARRKDATSPESRGLGTKGLTVVDFSYLASEYLQAMVAGLSFLGPVLEDRKESGGLLDVLVIGLGGGGMPMFLHHHLPCSVKVIEVDPVVVQLAKTFFDVSEDASFEILVADAISWIISAARADDGVSKSKNRRGGFDAVLIDVESAGGQCPPPAFLDGRFLMSVRELLRPRGVFAMNVVAPEETRNSLHRAVQESLGGRLYEWSVPQNSNRVLFTQRTSNAQGALDATPANGKSTERPSETDGAEALSTKGLLSECEAQSTDSSDCDLVYWASRLAECGTRTLPWGQGPDLPELAANIRTL